MYTLSNFYNNGLRNKDYSSNKIEIERREEKKRRDTFRCYDE
jgi:hypothetical protein